MAEGSAPGSQAAARRGAWDLGGRAWIWAALALAVFALGLNLAFGRRAYMPLDHSIVFDGGWRMARGQVPYRDFDTPNGLVPIAMQALLVKLLGPTWFGYVLHAALANALFAVAVWTFLAMARVPTLAALCASVAGAVCFYPPMGVPYMDQHAFLFCALALCAAAWGLWRGGGGWNWFAGGSCLALAWLSKQTPTVFLAPIVFGLALALPRGRRGRALGFMALGLSLCLGLGAFGLALIGGADPSRMVEYLLARPGAEGRARLAAFPSLLEFQMRLFGLAYAADLWSIRAHELLTLGLLGWLLVRLGSPPQGWQGKSSVVGPFALGYALLLASQLHSCFTSNQPELTVPLCFAGLALTLGALTRALRAAETSRKRAHSWANLALGITSLLVLRDVATFHWNVNRTRMASDVRFDAIDARDSRVDLHPSLRFLEWSVPVSCKYSAKELAGLIEFLREQPEPMFLLGDASILYGLTGKRSTAPSLWFHPGLAMPRPGEQDFELYEDRILAEIEAGVRLIVFEGDHTWMGLKLSDFPRLERLVIEKGLGLASFGSFGVVRLEME
jgi:hypothetical protein